jgi:hypothetical protein
MYKILLTLFVLTAFTACRKSDDTLSDFDDNGKKYNVSFTSAFEQSIEPYKSGSLPQTLNEVKPEYTRIYNLDQGGALVSSTRTDNKLPAGNYVAVFVYSNTFFSRVYGLGGLSEVLNFNEVFLDTRPSVVSQTVAINDIFYKKLYFTVKKKDINENVILDRIVAGLEVTIQDTMPEAVARLELTVNDAAVFNFKNDARESSVSKVKNFLPTDKILNAYVLGTGTRSVKIRAYDSNGLVLKEKTVDAPFISNKVTPIRCTLFNDTAPMVLANNTVKELSLTSGGTR